MNKLDLKVLIRSIRDVFRSSVITKVNELVDNNDYKSYVALVTQTSTNAPSVTVLRNNIGDIVWTRSGSGEYVGTLSNAFPSGKTYTLIGSDLNSLSDLFDDRRSYFKRLSNSTVKLESYTITFDPIGETMIKTATDSLLSFATIEIRVYN